MADANLQVKISAEDAFSGTFSHFNSAMSGIASAATAPVRALGGIIDTVGKVGLAISGMQQIVGGLVSTFGAPITAASDLNESLNKSQVVFGDAAGAIEAFSRTAATSLGLSQQKALEATGTFGNLFVSMGLGQAPAAEMSQQLVTLAGDLASFNNIRPEEALEKLRSGIVGEAEPLRALGVNLSAAAIEAQALADTHKATAKELTAADKATASYRLILQQTATAQGDFQNTSAGLANSQRIIKAEFDDLQAKIGTGFLPVIGKVTAFLAKELPDAFSSVEGYISPVVDVLDSVVQEVLTFIRTVQNISRENGLDVFSAIITALELRIGEVFGPTAQSIFHTFIDVILMLRDIGSEAFARISGYVTTFASIIDQALSGDAKGAAEGLVSLLASAADDIVATLQDWGKAFIDWIADTTRVLADGMGTDILQTVYDLIVGAVPVIGEHIAGWVDAFLSWFPEAYGRYLSALGDLAASILDWIGARAPDFITVFLTEWVPAFVGWVADVAVTIIPKMVELVANIVSWLITTGLPKLVAAVVAIGSAIGNGLVVAIEKMLPIIGDAFIRLAQGGLDAFKRVLGIASPSAVMQAMGEYVVEGFVNGVDGATEQATGAMDALAGAIGASMPVVLNASEQEVNKFQAAILAAQQAHGRSVEDAEKNHQQALADLQATYDEAKPADKAKVLQRIEDENVKYQRRLEDLETASSRKLEDLAASHGAIMASIAQREAEDRFRALQNLRVNLADVEFQTGAALEAVGEKTGQRINDAIASAASAIQDATARASEQIAAAQAGMELSRAIRGRREEFAAGQTAAADARRDAQEMSDLARKRGREDADAQERLAIDLANAKTEKDREGIQARFAASQADLLRRRQREDEDRAYAKQRAAEDRAFRQQQQAAAQAFSDELENEALARQIERINQERDTRITGINDALVAKEAAIAEDAKREVEQIVKSSADRIAKLKSDFFDKVGPMTAEAKDAVNAYISDVMGRVGELQAKAVAAAASVASIGATSGGANAITAAANRIVVTTTASGADIARAQQRMGGATYAEGGMSVPGGFALVGERGPELVQLPGGANVYTAGQSARMMGGGDDNRPVIINLDGQTIARSTWRHLKRLNATGGATLGLT